jgi:hypothetical protein
MEELKDIEILFKEFCKQADEFIKKEKEKQCGMKYKKEQRN